MYDFWEVFSGFIIILPLIVVALIFVWMKIYILYVGIRMVFSPAPQPTNRKVSVTVHEYDIDEDY